MLKRLCIKIFLSKKAGYQLKSKILLKPLTAKIFQFSVLFFIEEYQILVSNKIY
jgi:hypothetical protein